MRRIAIAIGVATLSTLILTIGSRLPAVSAQKNILKYRPVDQTGQFVPGRALVKFHEHILPDHARNIIAALGARDAAEIPKTGVHILDLPYEANEEAFVQAFQARPEVEFAELDLIHAPDQMVPNDPNYKSEWHLPKISAPSAWASTTGSPSVTIAILDTGIDGTHPDLARKLVPGWNFYDNNSDTNDVYGHGTAVAGTAAASSNNSQGVASLAWGCMIMPIRISDLNGYGSTSAMAKGLTWAADHGARVANISYRVSTSSSITSAASYFQNHGGVVTISAGNQSEFETASDNSTVLTISASDSNDALTSWSNKGNNVDLAAPGIGIYTTNRGGGYGSWWGTSFSAPVVAGVAALVISANPSLSATQVQNVLKQSADDRGVAGWDSSYGWGRVNAAAAVSLALSNSTADVTAPSVSFISPASGAMVSGLTSVAISASDNIGLAGVTVSMDGNVVASVAGSYNFVWDTSAVTEGTHTLQSVASDTSGNTSSATITVTVRNNVDTTPPAITITSPVEGSNVPANVSVSVNAADNIAVVTTELYVDGVLAGSSSSAPFTTKWNSRKAKSGSHTLQCKAYDSAGNVGLSQIVTVYK